MRGHITERSPGRWRIVVPAGFDEAGSRRQVVRTVHGSKRDAMRELTKMLRERDEGRLVDGRQPLGPYLGRSGCRRSLPSPSVAGRSRLRLGLGTRTRPRIPRVIGRVRLVDLRASHVVKVREGLLAEGLAPQTVSDILRVLSQALARAEAKGYCRNWAAAR